MTPDDEKITFTFLKAEKGSFPIRTGGKKVDMRGVYVKIRADVASDNYDEIMFVQVAMITFTLKDGKVVPQDPGANEGDKWRRPGAGFDPILGTPESDEPSLGWGVDVWSGATSPFYGYGRRGKEETLLGKNRSYLWDAPGVFGDKKLADERDTGIQIITSAIGMKKGEPPVFLGGVRWGFYVDKDGGVSFYPKKPEFVKTPSELGDALSRWNRIKGKTPLKELQGCDVRGKDNGK